MNTPQPPGIETSPTVLYICAAARSGSTLTDMFLGGHPDVASLGELNFLGKAVSLRQECTCGALVANCTAWNSVYDTLTALTAVDFRLKPYDFRLWDALASHVIDHKQQTRGYRAAVQLRKLLLELRERANYLGLRAPLPAPLRNAISNKLLLYRIIAHNWSKKVLVDSSKNQREAVELYRANPARLKIIFLVRDGRGVYLSQKSNGRDNARSLAGWRNYYQRALPLLEKNIPPEAIIRLRYEELVATPEHAARQLCAFAGIPYDPRMLDLTQATRHMVNGNDTRFSPSKGMQLDERWRRELTPQDLEFFERHGGGALNRRLGYT